MHQPADNMPFHSRVRTVMMAGICYFALVYAAGFVLGIIRTFAVTPHLGERWAELLEMPIMLVVIVLASRLVIHRFSCGAALMNRVFIGAISLAFLAAAEVAGIWLLRGQSIGESIAERDPISGIAFLLMMLVYALAPLFVRRSLPS
ncbi:MAG TPA: hypothetical protein PK400_03405 [Phycisphaerales bacterium]|nr:hypothetical protein [Phycisphaerales bacterium]HRQ76211.1 hypothetical protein [Phycisphaerales bacterium]